MRTEHDSSDLRQIENPSVRTSSLRGVGLAAGIVDFKISRTSSPRFSAFDNQPSICAPSGVSWKRKFHGGALVFIGFMLSPLSWWNDLFVNVPLAVGFAWIVSLFYKPAFAASVVAGYWLTNFLGFVLLHEGTRKVLAQPKPYNRRQLVQDLLISFVYTLLIVVLVRLKVLLPIEDYFANQ